MKRTFLVAFGLVASTVAASAQVTPVCTETFEYPAPGVFHAMTGGTGWSNAWWVGGAMNDDLQVMDNTMTPAFPLSDGVGGHAGQVVTWGSGWRQIDLPAHPDLLDVGTNMWGRDGATIWVSFSSMQFAGATGEHYGGLSLWKAGQAQPEALFLGSAWNDDKWGFDDEGPTGRPSEVVPSSDDSLPTRLVYRIDFQPGEERIRLWLDPAVPYPTGPADLDDTVVDLRFDEIRISTGGNNDDLFFFDAIEIAKGSPDGTLGTNYCVAAPNSSGATGSMSATGSLVAAENGVTLRASDLPTTSFGFFLTSQTQGFLQGPGGSQGNLCLGGAIGRYVGAGQIQNTGSTGAFALAIDLTQTPSPTGFVTVQAGETWSFQAWHRDSVGGSATSNFTDGLEIAFL
ncbi:MAG: hypothetical protein AAGB93_20565 [Planctomycetota bacterium]